MLPELYTFSNFEHETEFPNWLKGGISAALSK
jgi:hypothetical protein